MSSDGQRGRVSQCLCGTYDELRKCVRCGGSQCGVCTFDGICKRCLKEDRYREAMDAIERACSSNEKDKSMRTEEQILARIEQVKAKDWLGTSQQSLAVFLSAESVRPLMPDDEDLADWKAASKERTAIVAKLTSYMEFAIGKATGHRGISAGCSIEHFQAWLWMLDDYDKIDWDKYTNYGAPILRQICELYEIPLPDDEGFLNMSEGEQCRTWCEEGCG